jgi:hypothetical protein
MSNKTLSLIASLLVLSGVSSLCFAVAQDAARPAAKTTIPVPREVSAALEEMLKMVNEGKRPSKEEIVAIETMLQENKRNLMRFDEPGKVAYYMLSAWNSYFAGNADAAVQAIQAGIKSGPDDPDMKATYAAIATGLEKYPLMARLAPARPAAAQKKKKAGEEESMSSPAGSSGVLNFDFGALRAQAVSRKLAIAEATFDCVGGVTFSPAKSDLVCMLVYRTIAPREKAAASHSQSVEESISSSDSGTASAEGFGSLMLDYVGCEKVSFVGVSLDDAAAKLNVMREASAKRWFWPQIMAQDAKNRSLMEFAKFDITQPTMAIVTKDGTIAYMGAPTGFLPKMLLAKATDNYVARLFTPGSPIDPNTRKGRGVVDPNTARRRPADPNLLRSKGQGEEDISQMTSDLQAETLYNHAKSFLKGTRTTTLTAGPGVQLCRQILRQYPDTEYAAKARELLRDLPDEIKTRYNITNEEMGL